MADSPPRSSTGLTFAHYEVRRRDNGSPWELGRGAMGVTYQAHDPQLRIDVALKVINPAQVGDAKARALFLREARAAARVHHANVGNVVFLNPDPENMFYAMEFIAGESLKDWLHSRVPLSPLMAIGLSLQIARGLEAIHREEVIHRDLKPTNLMIVRADKQRPESDSDAWLIKIIDFGLARNVEGDVSETSAAANTTGFRGTALYASPEQCEERRDLDGRSDLYSLGCVMWEMLVGAPPFRANVHRELLNAHVAKPPPLQQLSHLPAGLQAVVKRLLAKDREGRFADAGALIRALEKCREQIERGERDGGAPDTVEDSTGLSEATTDLPPIETVAKTSPPRKFVVAFVAAILLVGLAIWWFGRRRMVSVATVAPTAGTSTPASPSVTSPSVAMIPEKSVAVLPFEDLGGGDGNRKWADAIQEDVLTDLSKIAGLKVAARSSVMRYRNSADRNLAEIGRQLGVRYVIDGTVQQAVDKLRVNVQLIDTRTGAPVWAERYDRNVSDVFALQADVAKSVAEQLNVKLTPAERLNIESPPTTDEGALDYYLRAREIIRGDRSLGAASGKKGEQVVRLLEQALARDSNFLAAHQLMTGAAVKYSLNAPKQDEKSSYLQKAEAGLAAAKRLAPEAPETRLSEAQFHYYRWNNRSYGLAREKLKQVLAVQPDNAEAWQLLGQLNRKVGQMEESLEAFQRAVQLDPNDNLSRGEGADVAQWLRRYDLARELRLSSATSPAPVAKAQALLRAARVEMARTGDLGALRAVIQQVQQEQPGALTEEALLDTRLEIAAGERDTGEIERLLAQIPAADNLDSRLAVANWKIELAYLRGDEKALRTLAQEITPDLEAEVKRLSDPGVDPRGLQLARVFSRLAEMRATAGDNVRAIADAKAACDLAKPENDYSEAMRRLQDLAVIYALVGEKKQSLSLLEELAAVPSELHYGGLKLDSVFDGLRGDPRFQALLARMAPKDSKRK